MAKSGCLLVLVLVLGIPSMAASGAEPTPDPFVHTAWQTFTTDDGLPHNRIRALCVDGYRVWVGTEAGLALHERGCWTSWTPSDGLPWPMISAIDVDPRTEDVWLGTWGGGLVRYSGGRFERFDQRDSGLAGNLIFDVLVDGDHVWVATNSGISLFNPAAGTWSLYVERRADAAQQVVTTLGKTGGDLYAGCWFGPVLRFNRVSRRWTPVNVARPSRGLQPARTPSQTSAPTKAHGWLDEWTMQIAPAGSLLWRTTPGGLWRYEGPPSLPGMGDAKGDESVPHPQRGRGTGTWEARRLLHRFEAGVGQASQPVSDRLENRSHTGPADLVYCLTPAGLGDQVWLGTDTGLHVMTDWDHDTWVTYHRAESGPGYVVNSQRGGRTIESRMLDSGIPDNRVRCVALQENRVWVGTVNGLALGSELRRWSDSGLRIADCGLTIRRGSNPSSTIRNPQSAIRNREAGMVTIAALGPTSRTMALPGADYSEPSPSYRPDLQAVQLAVEEFNRRGGYRGRLPFTLLTGPEGYTRYGWTTPEDDFAHYAYNREVTAIIGRLRPDDRIAAAAALQSALPLLNVAAGPVAAHERLNPWIFRCRGDRPRQIRLVAEHIFEAHGATRFAILRTPDTLGRTPWDLLSDLDPSRGLLSLTQSVKDQPARTPEGGALNPHPPPAKLVASPLWDPGDVSTRGELDRALGTIRDAGAQVVFTGADASESAAILRRMRQMGMTQPFVGSDRIVRRPSLTVGAGEKPASSFIELAGKEPGTVLAFLPARAREDHEAVQFAERFHERYRRRPAADAYPAYRAAWHLMEAISIAQAASADPTGGGLSPAARRFVPDRRAIRQALEAMSRGTKGEETCLHSSPRPVEAILARLEAGRWRFEILNEKKKSQKAQRSE